MKKVKNGANVSVILDCVVMATIVFPTASSGTDLGRDDGAVPGQDGGDQRADRAVLPLLASCRSPWRRGSHRQRSALRPRADGGLRLRAGVQEGREVGLR